MKLRLPRVEAPSMDNVERVTRVFCQLCGALARLALYLAAAHFIFRVASCDSPFVFGGPPPGSSQSEQMLISRGEIPPTAV